MPALQRAVLLVFRPSGAPPVGQARKNVLKERATGQRVKSLATRSMAYGDGRQPGMIPRVFRERKSHEAVRRNDQRDTLG